MKIKILLFTTALVCAVLGLLFLINSRTERQGAVAFMALSRYNNKVAVIGGKLLIFGGLRNVRNKAEQIEEYDFSTGRLTLRKAVMKTMQHCFAVAAARGKVYLIGSDQKGSVEEYDPDRDVTVSRKPSAVWRNDVAAAGLNGRIYVAGGFLNGKATGMLEEYDPETETWKRCAAMPTPRGGLGLVVLQGKIYAIGGSDEKGGSAAVEEYDPSADRWQVRAPMRHTRTFFGAAVAENTLLAFGGQKNSQEIEFLQTVEEYSPDTNSWTEKEPLPYRLGCMDVGIYKDKAYVCGGLTLARAIKAVAWPGDIGARQIMEYPIR